MSESTTTTPETTTPEGAVTRDDVIRKAYSDASRDLRENHRDEFNAAVKKYAADNGFDWSPKKTQKEKDREALEALLAANPDFIESIKG